MEKPAKLRIYTSLAVLTIIIGFALLIMMIVVEDEPGALPLFLILLGSGSYLLARRSARSAHKRPR